MSTTVTLPVSELKLEHINAPIDVTYESSDVTSTSVTGVLKGISFSKVNATVAKPVPGPRVVRVAAPVFYDLTLEGLSSIKVNGDHLVTILK